MGTTDAPAAGLDPLLSCLSRYERRFAVLYLDEEGGLVPIEEIAGALARQERADVERGAVEAGTADRNRILEALRFRHLPTLAAEGIVEVRGEHVRLCDERAAPVVDRLHAISDDLGFAAAPQDERREPIVTYEQYSPDQERTLSEAVVDAIRAHRADDFLRTDYLFFEDVDFAALNRLFHDEAQPRTRVVFTTETVRVELWGERGVRIRVADVPSG